MNIAWEENSETFGNFTLFKLNLYGTNWITPFFWTPTNEHVRKNKKETNRNNM